MKNYATIAASLLLITTFAFGLPQDPVAADAQPAGSPAPPPAWPRTFQKEGNTLVMCQPQVDSWDKRRHIRFRSAITLTQAGSSEQHVGVVAVKADTTVDRDAASDLLLPGHAPTRGRDRRHPGSRRHPRTDSLPPSRHPSSRGPRPEPARSAVHLLLGQLRPRLGPRPVAERLLLRRPIMKPNVHVHLVVSNLDRSAAFYEALFGTPVKSKPGCHANQDKFWVRDPDGVEWEFYNINFDVEEPAPAAKTAANCCI